MAHKQNLTFCQSVFLLTVDHTVGLGMQAMLVGICQVTIGISAGSLIVGSQCIGLNGVCLSVIGRGPGLLVLCHRCRRCALRIGEDWRLVGKMGENTVILSQAFELN